MMTAACSDMPSCSYALSKKDLESTLEDAACPCQAQVCSTTAALPVADHQLNL